MHSYVKNIFCSRGDTSIAYICIAKKGCFFLPSPLKSLTTILSVILFELNKDGLASYQRGVVNFSPSDKNVCIFVVIYPI